MSLAPAGHIRSYYNAPDRAPSAAATSLRLFPNCRFVLLHSFLRPPSPSSPAPFPPLATIGLCSVSRKDSFPFHLFIYFVNSFFFFLVSSSSELVMAFQEAGWGRGVAFSISQTYCMWSSFREPPPSTLESPGGRVVGRHFLPHSSFTHFQSKENRSDVRLCWHS